MSDKKKASEEDGEELPGAPIPPVKDKAIVFLNGDIGPGHLAICSELLNYHYSDFDGEIQLLINSDGGHVSVGWAIVDVMNFIRLPVRTVALGMCCSMAADIFVNGDERVMGEHATLMIHPHSAGRIGSYSDLLAAQKMDDIEHTRRMLHYLNNSDLKTLDDVEEILFSTRGDDLFLTPDECISHGLCDSIARTDKAKRRKEYRTYLGTSGKPVKASATRRRKKS